MTSFESVNLLKNCHVTESIQYIIQDRDDIDDSSTTNNNNAQEVQTFGTCTLTQLSGGMVNYVYRLHSFDPLIVDGVDTPIHSVVVKHYRSYLSAFRTVNLTSDRYFIEKSCLSTIAPSLPITSTTKEQQIPIVKVPRLLQAIDEHKVLIMEDLGCDWWSLFDYLHILSDDDHVPTNDRNNGTAVDENDTKKICVDEDEAHILLTKMIDGIDAFLKQLCTISRDNSVMQQQFYCPGTKEMYTDYVYTSFEKRINKNPKLSAFQRFIPMVQQEIEHIKSTADQNSPGECLTFGDLWPSAVVIPKNQTSKVNWDIALIDFEFARYEHPLCDYFQFLSYLLLFQYDRLSHRELAKKAVNMWIEKIYNRLRTDDTGTLKITRGNIIQLVSNISLEIAYTRFEFDDMENVANALVQFIESFIVSSECDLV